MPQHLNGLPRFGLKHLLIVVLAASVGLTAYALIARSKQRAIINDVYGHYEVYQLLRTSTHFEVFRVNKKENNNAIYWAVPEENWIAPCGIPADRITTELRSILTAPQNFVGRFAKDFVFRPTVRLRAASDSDRVDLYFCFRSKEAAIVENGDFVRFMAIDNVSGALNDLLSSLCPTAGDPSTSKE
jgi:hypothetical protein